MSSVATGAQAAETTVVTTTVARDTHWLPGIEALRALAASAVVLHHMLDLANSPSIPGGTIIEGFGEWGVDVFFILSAFLLSEYFWHDRRSLRVFYTRRALRIGPAYYACVLILFLFFADRTILFTQQGVHQVFANASFTQWLTPGTSSSLNVDGALWTLTIEMLLYLALPLMAIPFRRHPYATFVTLCAIGLGWRFWVVHSAQPLQHIAFGDVSGNAALEANARLYLARQFLGYLPLFAVGIMVRWLVVHRRLPRYAWLDRVQGSSLGILLLLLLPSVLLLNVIVPASNWQHWFWFIGFDTILGLFVAGALVYASRPVARALHWPMRAAVWLGKRSYGLYLWHFPVVLALYERGPLSAPPRLSHFALRFVLIWVLAVAFAAASYRFVEKPAMDYGKLLTRRWQTRAREATA